MQVDTTALDGVLILVPRVFEDDRGYFMESWNQSTFDDIVGNTVQFVQDNQSVSRRGVLRGLHYQLPPHAQGKLVRCTRGAVWDVAVDVRRSSPTFGQWIGQELSHESQRQMWIPPGFAHGFVALADEVTVQYKTTDYYEPRAERTIKWNDPRLDISWPELGDVTVSEKDQAGVPFEQAEVFE